MDYAIHLFILVGIYLILAQSFNLAFGLGKMFNLAHIASYAIGAYTTALLSVNLSQNFWICIAASMTLSGLFALLIGAISLKLQEDYFAVGTLAFSAVVNAVLNNWKSLTRGVLGIPGIPRPDVFLPSMASFAGGEQAAQFCPSETSACAWHQQFAIFLQTSSDGNYFYDNRHFLVLLSVFVLITLLAFYFIFESSFARRLRAQAENAYAAMSLGLVIKDIRNDSFIVSSLFAGLAGSFFAYYINYIDPSSFGLHEMVFVLSIVIIGKPGSFWGVILSTVFLVLLPEPLRFINIPPSILGPMRQLLYSLILFGVVYWKRATLFPVERTV